MTLSKLPARARRVYVILVYRLHQTQVALWQEELNHSAVAKSVVGLGDAGPAFRSAMRVKSTSDSSAPWGRYPKSSSTRKSFVCRVQRQVRLAASRSCTGRCTLARPASTSLSVDGFARARPAVGLDDCRCGAAFQPSRAAVLGGDTDCAPMWQRDSPIRHVHHQATPASRSRRPSGPASRQAQHRRPFVAVVRHAGSRYRMVAHVGEQLQEGHGGGAHAP